MILTRPLWTLVFVLPPLAASHGCSINMSENSGTPHVSAPPPAPSATTRAPVVSARAPTNPSVDLGDEPDDETDEQAWQSIRKALGKGGDLRDGVLAFVFPRNDLNITLQGNDIPVAAGLASEFRFYRCPCGLLNVVGQFVVADYEANDVLDALREGHVEIASVGPLLLHERPRLLLIRFQGENKRGGVLAKALRTALSWTGEERMAPQQKIDLPK